MPDREMKDEHHEIQTPKQESLAVSSNRKSKSINAQSKKLHHQHQKTTKTNVSSGFTPITVGHVALNLSEKESIGKISSVPVAIDADQSILDISKTDLNSDVAPVSDDTESAKISSGSEAFVFYDDQSSIESYIASFSQHISPSFITTPLSSKSPAASTPLSCITTAEMTPSSSTSTITTDAVIHEATIDNTKSVKLESLVKHLRESTIQILHSSDIDPDYKNLLDALIKTVIEHFCTSHEDTSSIVKPFSKKVKLMMLSYLLVMLLGSAGFFLFSDAQSCYHGPPPT